MRSICLNMVVKDEAPVIQRVLASVKPWIDSWCIVDTGSTDNTPDLIQKALRGLPGELLYRPWVNFAHNRSEAIDLAKERYPSADYLLFIDADDELVMPEGFHWPDLTADAYSLILRRGNLDYRRPVLASTHLPWRYEGVLHEYLTCYTPHKVERLNGPFIQVHSDGARSRDPHKYEKDIRILEDALRQDPFNARYTFYLAQSYRDAGMLNKALETYQTRVSMGGWDEERWYALYQIALLRETLHHGSLLVRDAYLNAFQFRPSRAESMGQLARYCKAQGDNNLASIFSAVAKATPPSQDALVVDRSWYQ